MSCCRRELLAMRVLRCSSPGHASALPPRDAIPARRRSESQRQSDPPPGAHTLRGCGNDPPQHLCRHCQSSRCLIANDAIRSCSTCYPAKTEPRAILRSQLLGWRITCALCGSLLQYPKGHHCPSSFGHYHATALIGERLLHDEASRKARTWVSPARIARLLLMRRVKNPS